jgi:hypothetical protein
MDVILNNREHLNLRWNPAARYDPYYKEYRDSIFGWIGPGSTPESIAKAKREWKKPPISKTINFYIRFKASATPELFHEELPFTKSMAAIKCGV